MIKIGLATMTSYHKLGSLLFIFGLWTSGNSAGRTPEYFYNRAESIMGEAQEWMIEHLVEYLSKPILLLC